MKLSLHTSYWIKYFLLAIPVIVLAAVVLTGNSKELDLLDRNNKFLIQPYFDTYEGGNSKSEIISYNPYLEFVYTLRPGYSFPYAGIVIQKEKKDFVNLSEFNQLRLTISASKGRKISVFVAAYVPGFTDSSKILTYRYFEKSIDVDVFLHPMIVDLEDFSTPAWWYQVNNVSESKLPPADYSKIAFINIQNCILIPKNVEDKVTIEKLFFYYDNTMHILYALVFACIYYLAFIAVSSYPTISSKNELVIKYEKVETVDVKGNEQEKVIAYISSAYSQPDLVLEKIQKSTGISELKISFIIKSVSGLTFKQYLNRLRLQEARRLLKETDLQISEIAYKVGYGHISHFNRVFKDETGYSPNDYRKEIISD